ncbi:hypothetical protein L6164_031394 [Bauhinia variegata]|uniref:Uncharacterized protein n=1 Tax=Bauhinia variegata TaxID=167791 RepID=A0ACB9LGQ1_BAUVA|nr:hypothetical protein L6164_031394 [Bauhinia variegata]
MYENCTAFEDMMPVGLGKLTSLQCLRKFVVAENPVEEIATLNELKDLNNLREDLFIEKLNLVQDVASESKEVNLNRKRYLQSLWLDWGDSEDNKNSDSLQLLDNLHPHQNLKDLTVLRYPGVGFSNWLSSLTNVVSIHLFGFKNCHYIPPLEGLASLKSLVIEHMDALEYICFEIYQEISSTNASSSLAMPTRVFFPSLERLVLNDCPNLWGWKWIYQQHQQDLLLPPFPCLSSLSITNCWNLVCMPTFPYLVEKLTLFACNVTPLIDTLITNMVTSTPTRGFCYNT